MNLLEHSELRRKLLVSTEPVKGESEIPVQYDACVCFDLEPQGTPEMCF